MKAEAIPSAFATEQGGNAVSTAPTLAAAPARRLKLWDLDEKYHCPVIGTCVPMDELVRFARRFRFAADPGDEFALHAEAVALSLHRNGFAEALQKYLERKYAMTVRQFNVAHGDHEVRAMWRESLGRGEVAAPMWATLTHKHASDDTRHTVYADIHMLSHQVGAGQAADARRLAFLEKENAEQRRGLVAERREAERRNATLARQVEELQARLARSTRAEQDAEALRARLARFEDGSVVVDMGRRLAILEIANQRLLAESNRVWVLEKTLAACRAEATRFATERNQFAAEADALERVLMTDEACAGECALDQDDCPLPPPAANERRSVLCVGGRTALVAQYRNLAQRLGIRLVHHDGGQEEALSRLPDMIAGADAVICPTDCVSHSAYYQLKNQCRRSGKPCLLFKGAGVSSVALALARVTAGQTSLPGVASDAPA
ncbi:MAG: DUF2325 domain-containing protein [Rhodocyclales bacterium]|nr:DUF2325 domain-containing protein [Rhodocyclales bacterium]